MSDLFHLISEMRRPRLLIRAAHFALADYRRERDLRRIVKTEPHSTAESAIRWLWEEEKRLEAIRRAGDATYSFARHIEVLVAMLAEIRLVPRKLA